MCYIGYMDFIVFYVLFGVLTASIFALIAIPASKKKENEHVVENIIVAGIVWPGTLVLMVAVAITM